MEKKMAANSNKRRQAKQAKRKAKSKAKQKQGRIQRGPSLEKIHVSSALKNEIAYCGIQGELDSGICTIIVTKDAGEDKVLFASFNVDTFCLGIKDSYMNIGFEEDVQKYVERTEQLDPESAKKLIEGAVNYADQIGFKPNKEFKDAFRIFADTDSEKSKTEYEYGKDGKPFFIQGPFDTPAKSKEIIRTLEKSCGENGSDFFCQESFKD